MPRFPRKTLACAAVLAATLVTQQVFADVFVRPRRPSQTNVRYSDFEWKHIDILVGENASGTSWDRGPRVHDVAPEFRTWNAPASDEPPPTVEPGVPPPERPDELEDEEAEKKQKELGPRAGGVRLFFYERERKNAERAAASIERSYRYLSEKFEFVPRKTFPLILYNTYLEFLQTNLFPIQEGVLGVTSTRGLEVTLPYFGDFRQFDTVARHELVHQFTLQKVRWAAGEFDASGDPVGKLPLWLVEGMAEYYTHGYDDEAEALVRDIFLHPKLERYYVFRNFFEDRPWDFIWTYKLGQARCAFLEQTYGEGILQKILEHSPRMVNIPNDPLEVPNFQTLLGTLTGDNSKVMSQKFETWIKRRSYEAFQEAKHHPEDLTEFPETRGRVQALAGSPDGTLLLYRSIRPMAGRSALFLVDHRDPRSTRAVVRDQRPGVESLHPVAGQNFDVGESLLAYVAQYRGRDVVYTRSFTREVEPKKEKDDPEAPKNREPSNLEQKIAREDRKHPEPRKPGEPRLRVDIDFEDRRRYDVAAFGLATAEAVSVAPDGERLAIIGTTLEGQLDLWVIEPSDDDTFDMVRLTADPHAERGVDWGEDGIVYSSNATAHGKFNLFRIEGPEFETVTQLTSEPVDHFGPQNLPGGRVVFARYDELGANVYEVADGGIVRRTSVTTGLYDVSPGPDGGIWALYHRSGRRSPVRMSKQKFVADSRPHRVVEGDIEPPPERSLDDAEPYRAYQPRNWKPGFIFALLGYAGDGLFGQAFASAHDTLRNHTLTLTLLAQGTFELTEGSIFYTNQKQRTSWGTGVFQNLNFRINPDRPSLPPDETPCSLVGSAERFYGGTGTIRYPFDRFLFVQAQQSLGAAQYFTLQSARRCNIDVPFEDPRFQSESVLSFGYSTIRYNRFTGPIGGRSVLLESTLTTQPFHDELFGTLRLDAEQYVPIAGRWNVFLRGGAGRSLGPDDVARQFFLSSWDTMRAVNYGDPQFLLGRSFFYATSEMQFPLDFLIRIAFLDLEGIVAMDFGGVGDDFPGAFDRRVLNFATGLNFGIGYFILRLHWAKAFDIGALLPNNRRWNTNFSLAYRYW